MISKVAIKYLTLLTTCLVALNSCLNSLQAVSNTQRVWLSQSYDTSGKSNKDGITYRGTGRFEWVQVNDAAGYQWAITNHNDVPWNENDRIASAILESRSATSASYNLGNGRYKFWVIAKDSNNNFGSWISSNEIVIDFNDPRRPENLSSPSSPTDDNTPNVSWSGTDSGDSGIYFFKVEFSGSRTHYFYSTNSKLDNNEFTTTLNDGEWDWRVRAYDVAGNEGSWSSWNSIVVKNDTEGPYAPRNIRMDSNDDTFTQSGRGTNSDRITYVSNPRFYWDTPRDRGGSSISEYQWAVTDQNKNPYSNEADRFEEGYRTTTYVDLPSLPDGNYLFWVQASDSGGNWGDWDEIRFTIDTERPRAPVPINPENPTNSTKPRLSWTDAEGAENSVDFYKIQLTGPSTHIFYTNVKALTEENYLVELGAGVWTWKVQCFDLAGNVGDWSEPIQISINSDVSGPVIDESAIGATVDSNNSLVLTFKASSPIGIKRAKVNFGKNGGSLNQEVWASYQGEETWMVQFPIEGNPGEYFQIQLWAEDNNADPQQILANFTYVIPGSSNPKNIFEEIGKEDQIQNYIDDLWSLYFKPSEFLVNDTLGLPTGIFYYATESNSDGELVKQTNAFGELGYIWNANPEELDVRSEGLSYGMMIAVLLDQKDTFDAIWNWAKSYAQRKPPELYTNLFAWRLTKEGIPIDKSMAPDGDIWIAASLILAHSKWPNASHPYDYANQAKLILAAAKEHLFEQDTKLIRFSPTEGSGASVEIPIAELTTDPSYHSPAFFDLFAKFFLEMKGNYDQNSDEWIELDVLEDFYLQAAEASREFLQKTVYPETGLSPDYSYFSGAPKPTYYGGDPSDRHDRYQQDAWRTAFHVALDYRRNADKWPEPPEGFIGAGTMISKIQEFFFSKGIFSYPCRWEIDGSAFDEENEGNSHGCVAMNAAIGNALLKMNSTNFGEDIVRRAHTLAFVKKLEDPVWGDYRYYDGLLTFLGLLEAADMFDLRIRSSGFEEEVQEPTPEGPPLKSNLLGDLNNSYGVTIQGPEDTLAGRVYDYKLWYSVIKPYDCEDPLKALFQKPWAWERRNLFNYSSRVDAFEKVIRDIVTIRSYSAPEAAKKVGEIFEGIEGGISFAGKATDIAKVLSIPDEADIKLLSKLPFGTTYLDSKFATSLKNDTKLSRGFRNLGTFLEIAEQTTLVADTVLVAMIYETIANDEALSRLEALKGISMFSGKPDYAWEEAIANVEADLLQIQSGDVWGAYNLAWEEKKGDFIRYGLGAIYSHLTKSLNIGWALVPVSWDYFFGETEAYVAGLEYAVLGGTIYRYLFSSYSWEQMGKYEREIAASTAFHTYGYLRGSLENATIFGGWVYSTCDDSSVNSVLMYLEDQYKIAEQDLKAVLESTEFKENQPDIDVLSTNGLQISNQDFIPSEIDGTDFGIAVVGGDAIERSFDLFNYGGVPLQVGSITITNLPETSASVATSLDSFQISQQNYLPTASNVDVFQITSSIPTSIAPGEKETLTVRFNPDSVGQSTASVVIASNDSNETSYSFAISGNGDLTPTVQKPVIAPEGGDYLQPVSVQIYSNTANALIRYTLDGSEPDENSSIYNQTLLLEGLVTVKAKGFKNGYTNSETVSVSYDVQLIEKLQTPVISPGTGSYNNELTITITSTDENVRMYYTLNGSIPTESSSQYNGAITISSSADFRARAFKEGWIDSNIAGANYDVVAVPINEPPVAVAGPDLFSVEVGDTGFGPVVLNGENSYDPNDSIAQWEWSWGVGSQYGEIITTEFPIGTIEVKLTVIDELGESSSDSLQVTVHPNDSAQGESNWIRLDLRDPITETASADYVSWIDGFFSEEEKSRLTLVEVNEDPDGDGLDNNFEFLAKLDPTDIDSSVEITFVGDLRERLSVSPVYEGVNFLIEYSTDMREWKVIDPGFYEDRGEEVQVDLIAMPVTYYFRFKVFSTEAEVSAKLLQGTYAPPVRK